MCRKNSTFLGEKWDKGVPIEVLPLAYNPVMLKIQSQLGGRPKLRLAKSKAVSHFWLIWYAIMVCNVIMICPSCIVVVRHRCRHRPVLASASVHSPPSHRIQDRNFIFSMNMHMCPQYMHIKYLFILNCSF